MPSSPMHQASFALRPLAVPACGRFLGEIDSEVLGVAVADGVGDAFLNAAIEREVDRLAIGIGKLAERESGTCGPGMAALEAGDKLVDQLGELDAAERSGPKLLQRARFISLRRSTMRENLADAMGDLAGALDRSADRRWSGSRRHWR